MLHCYSTCLFWKRELNWNPLKIINKWLPLVCPTWASRTFCMIAFICYWYWKNNKGFIQICKLFIALRHRDFLIFPSLPLNSCSEYFREVWGKYSTAQNMKFSIKDFFSKCEQIYSFLRIWLHLPKKFWMENFILCAASVVVFSMLIQRCIQNTVKTSIMTIMKIKSNFVLLCTFSLQKLS